MEYPVGQNRFEINQDNGENQTKDRDHPRSRASF
jgi:hypothetical protein